MSGARLPAARAELIQDVERLRLTLDARRAAGLPLVRPALRVASFGTDSCGQELAAQSLASAARAPTCSTLRRFERFDGDSP